MAVPTAGSESDKGRKYELSVAALLAFLLSENKNVENYRITSNLEQYNPFDDVVAEVHFKESEENQTYAVQTKCGKIDKFKIEKYIAGYNKIQEEGSSQLKQNIGEDRIQFWYFSPMDISNFNRNSNLEEKPKVQYSTTGPKDILDITHFYKLDCDKYNDFCKVFYLFLEQPDTKQIIKEIKIKWKIEDPWQIILYLDKQFAESSEGVDKASFEHELLKIRLSNYIVTPTEATLFRHQAVNDWNRLTLEHNVTIVGKEWKIEQHLYGCILNIQSLVDVIDVNKWNRGISNGGKLDEEVTAQLKERSIKAETLKDFMMEMWVKNKVPLFLQTDAPLPILEEFRHLNKSYVIIDSNPEKRSEEIQAYNLSVFRHLYDVKDDKIIKNIVVSLQGRQQASFDEIVDEDRELLKTVTCLDIINLIKPREIFLKKECLDGINYMLFLIETADPQENDYDTLRPTGDNITIYCTPGESLKYYEKIIGDSRFRSYKTFRLRSTSDNRLILLSEKQKAGAVGGDNEKCGLECFFVDQNGENVHNIKNSDPIPIVGYVPIHVSGRLIPRYLSSNERGKRFAEQEFFKESNSPITIITGEAGIGKTTLLHSLFRFCEIKYYVFFVNLVTYQSYLVKRSQKFFQNPLRFLYDRRGIQPYNGFLTSLRNHTNRVILILDSFDEVVATCEEQVLELIEKLQKAGLQKILIASRLTAVGLLRNKFNEAETFKVEGLGEELKQYIGNWNLNIDDLDNIPSKFLHNPLYLGMLRTLSDEGKNLTAANTWDLFEGIVNLKMENYSRQIEPYCLDESDKQDILSWYWQLALQVVIGTNEVTQKLIRISRRNFARVGFITYYDNENPNFVHHTVAEFFVGQWLIKNIDQHDAKFVYRSLLDRRDIRILEIISERMPLHKFMLRRGVNVRDLSCMVDESNILETDALGRNILCLLAIYLNYSIALAKAWDFLEFLIYYMRKKKYDIYMRDRIMNWTWVDYVEYYRLEQYFLKRSEIRNSEFIAVREAYVNYYATHTEKLGQFPLSRNFNELYNNALYYSSINMIQDLLLLKYHQNEAFSEFRNMCLDSNARMDERFLKFHLPEEKLTGMHLACIYSNIEALKIYIENQTNLDVTDIFNCTPLHYGVIAKKGDEIVKLLSEHGETSFSKVGQSGHSTTILHMSARTGNVNVIKMLLERYGDLQYSRDSENYTPLEVALKSNLTDNYGGYDSTDLDVLKALLEKGNVYHRDDFGFLESAVRNKNMNVAEILLNHGVNATPGLRPAIENNDEDFTELLLKNGADPNYLFSIHTALMLAIIVNKRMNYNSSERESNLKTIDLLLQYGADVHKTNKSGHAPLDCIALHDSAEDVVQKLLDHKTCDVNSISQCHLHEAIKRGKLKIVELFLKKGARVDCTDAYGRTPLNYAVKKGEEAFVQILLEYKADINCVDQFGFTPLITAVEIGDIKIAELLLRKGAKVDFRNKFGMTALYVAAFKENISMTKLLLERGTNVNTRTLGDQILYNAKQVKKIEAVVRLSKDRTISQNPGTAGNHNESDLAVHSITEKVEQNWAGVDLELELGSAVQERINLHTTHKRMWSNRKIHEEYWTEACCRCEEMNGKDVDDVFFKKLKNPQLDDVIAYICNTPSASENLNIIKVLPQYYETGYKVFKRTVVSNNWEALQIVLQNYNDGDIDFKFNPLYYAVCIQDEDMIKILLKRNFYINRIDRYDCTPLGLASGLENIPVVEMLLKNGTDANLEWRYGISPLRVAAPLENRYMADLLLSYGTKPSIPTIEYSELLSITRNYFRSVYRQNLQEIIK